MYQINYYNRDNRTLKYDFLFHSKWAALYHARRIRDSYGLRSDVMDKETGEILAIFNLNDEWVCDEFYNDNKII